MVYAKSLFAQNIPVNVIPARTLPAINVFRTAPDVTTKILVPAVAINAKIVISFIVIDAIWKAVAIVASPLAMMI